MRKPPRESSREQGFRYWLGVALILQSWACATRDQPAEQIPAMHEGMALYRATDATMWVPYVLTLVAEVDGAASQPDAGRRLLDEARTVMDSTQERFYEAEGCRVQGEWCWPRRRTSTPWPLPAASKPNPGSCGRQ